MYPIGMPHGPSADASLRAAAALEACVKDGRPMEIRDALRAIAELGEQVASCRVADRRPWWDATLKEIAEGRGFTLVSPKQRSR